MTLSSLIFAKREGETDEAFKLRHDKAERVFRAALANKAGHELIQLIINHRNPTHARFGNGRNSETAAFIDGQSDVISTLMLYGTNLGISKPDEQ